MDSLSVSQKDGYYILTAFSRLTNISSDVTDFCSRSHETEFLCPNNIALLSNVQDQYCGYGCCSDGLVSLFKNVVNADEPIFRDLLKEFIKEFNKKHYAECFLWCASLLTDFHKKDECSKYMTLALKLKLVAYEGAVYCFDEKQATVNSTIVQILNYISMNKFIQYYPCEDANSDPLHEVLPEIFEPSNLLRFNFFSCRSILHHLKRFLVLVSYGYEDRYYKNACQEYMEYIVEEDWENLFGFDNRTESKMAHKKYRCYQVLVLYIKKFHDTDDDNSEFYDEVLRILWKSITDPFITQRQFLSSFKHSSSYPEFLSVWQWYEKVVLGGKESVTSSRSLEHLSRCAVRRRLTVCFQMPGGIDSFYIPTKIKNYLRLKS